MYVYNQTVNIDEKVHLKWIQWMQKTHIPKVLDTKLFYKAATFKVLINEEMGGVTYSTQYFAKDKASLQLFYKNYQLEFQQQMAAVFPNQFVFFETELQLIDEISV